MYGNGIARCLIDTAPPPLLLRHLQTQVPKLPLAGFPIDALVPLPEPEIIYVEVIRRASSRACVITITGGLITVGYAGAGAPTKRVKPPFPQSLSSMMTTMS